MGGIVEGCSVGLRVVGRGVVLGADDTVGLSVEGEAVGVCVVGVAEGWGEIVGLSVEGEAVGFAVDGLNDGAIVGNAIPFPFPFPLPLDMDTPLPFPKS